MNNPKQLSIACAGFSPRLLLGAILASTSLVFLFAGFTMAQTKSGDSPLLPWIGVWSITDSGSATADPTQKSTVEIRPTSDQKGLEISRTYSQATGRVGDIDSGWNQAAACRPELHGLADGQVDSRSGINPRIIGDNLQRNGIVSDIDAQNDICRPIRWQRFSR